MKKKIMILSLAAAPLFGFNAMAQNDNDCNDPAYCPQQCYQPNGPSDKMYRPTSIEEMAFEGILLTPEQQAAVDQVKATRKAQREQFSAQERTEKANRMEARQKAKRDYLKQMQAILTPDQYVTFLENIVVAQPQGRPGKIGDKARADKGPKGDKFGQKGKMKADKAAKVDKNAKKDKKERGEKK